MSQKQIHRTSNIFWINLTILAIFGIWNPFQRKSLKFIYNIYLIFVIFDLIISISLMHVDTLVHIDDIDIVATNLPASITGTTNIIKILYFLSKHKTVTRLIDQLNKGLYPGGHGPILRQEEIRSRRRSRFFTILMFSFALISVISGYIKAATVVANFDISSVPLNDTEPIMKFMRFRQWFPKPWYHKYYGWVILSPVIGILTWSATTDIGFDAFLASLKIHVTCQFEIIQKRIFDFEKGNQIKDTERFSLLRKCLIHHQNSIKLVHELQSLLGPFLLVQFVCSTIILGIGLFHFAILADTTQKLVRLSYMINMLAQLWWHCYFGEQLSTQSENIANQAYLTAWESYPFKYKYCISILMLRAQNPLKISAGKFYILSVETFRNILSTSFSYYTLLKEMN